MNYGSANRRDVKDQERDVLGGLRRVIREIRAIRGSLQGFDHGWRIAQISRPDCPGKSDPVAPSQTGQKAASAFSLSSTHLWRRGMGRGSSLFYGRFMGRMLVRRVPSLPIPLPASRGEGTSSDGPVALGQTSQPPALPSRPSVQKLRKATPNCVLFTHSQPDMGLSVKPSQAQSHPVKPSQTSRCQKICIPCLNAAV
jgi:hypothetical protein